MRVPSDEGPYLDPNAEVQKPAETAAAPVKVEPAAELTPNVKPEAAAPAQAAGPEQEEPPVIVAEQDQGKIVKIQAMAKGKRDRKRVAGIKEDKEMNMSASKIQAVARGRRDRAHVANIKATR